MKTGNTSSPAPAAPPDTEASMEPGHEDREYAAPRRAVPARYGPQWSPAMKTGNTCAAAFIAFHTDTPQWSPAMKTGNT